MKKLSIITLIFLLSGCSSSGKKSIDKLYFRFPEATKNSIDKKIEIKRPQAMGIIGNRPMVVLTKEGGLMQMQHHFWLDSPKVLLQNYLEDTLGKEDETNYVLSSTILNLEKDNNSAVVAIKFLLADKSGNTILNKTYKQQTEINGESISDFAHTAQRLINEIVAQLVDEIQ